MIDLAAIRAELPLLVETPGSWAELAADHLDEFLADHAVCEQQAALFGLSLIGHYPEDNELVERMGALAAEEVSHLRRVHSLLRQRGHSISHRRTNPWVQGLRQRIGTTHQDLLKVDRLLVGALIEARSCERFSTLLAAIHDREFAVARLLKDLGPAEKRHWRMFFDLAQREIDSGTLQDRWRGWLEFEAELSSRGGKEPRVHG
ncbi:MAG: tRNA isopentenyl-2-thiomethyl-A-37 hydroxylase MiaE [Acidobacteriota bacterium]